MEQKKIIELFNMRDERAVEETNRLCRKYCFAIALNILGNSDDAEECWNDTLEALWKAIPPAQPSDLTAYAAKTARNISIDRLRSEKAKKRIGDVVPLHEIDDCLASFDDFSEIEIREKINAFLATCTKTERSIFVLRYYFCYPSSDIAAKAGMTDSAVRKQLSRTRARLKNYFKKED